MHKNYLPPPAGDRVNPVFFAATVNLTTCRIVSLLNVVLYAIFIIRILYGPFPLVVVVVYHYVTRLTFVSFLTMITFNRVLKTLFILDFQRISLIPERRVVRWFGFVTAFASCFYLIQEAIVRNFRGLNHYGSWAISTYLGKVTKMMLLKADMYFQGNIQDPKSGEGGTGDLLLYPLLGLVLSSLYLRHIQSISERTLLQRCHNSVTNSTANGSNNIFIYCVIFFLGVFFSAVSLLKSLGFRDNITFDGKFPLIYFPIMTFHTIVGSTCFLWNIEFKNFLIRKIQSNFSNKDLFHYIANNRIQPILNKRKNREENPSELEFKTPQNRTDIISIPSSILLVQEVDSHVV